MERRLSGLSDVDLKIKEAETCYAMGMFEEALVLYEHVIASGQSISPQARQTLSEKVSRLKKEILERQASERKGLSPEDISIFRKTMSATKRHPHPPGRGRGLEGARPDGGGGGRV